jgi:hypothetical protein
MGPGPRGPRGGMGYEFMCLIDRGFQTSHWNCKQGNSYCIFS